MTCLPTRDELLAAGSGPNDPANIPSKSAKPRVSGLSKDAREIAYYMAGTTPSDWGALDASWTQEQGRLAEELTISRLGLLGIPVVGRQEGLPDDLPVTGHPDGQLISVPDQNVGRLFARTIQDYYQEHKFQVAETLLSTLFADHQATLRFGDHGVVGFENKHFGRYGYEKILKLGLEAAEPEIIAQISLYGYALGWDSCYVAVTSQDASSIRGDMTQNRKVKDRSKMWVKDDMNPKLSTFVVDLRPYYNSLVPILLRRAEFFVRWMEEDGDPTHIAWESTPNPEQFPWSYSPYCTLALQDGQGSLVAPGLPWKE